MEKTVTLEEALKRIEELEKENAELREELEYYRNRKLSGRQKHNAKWMAIYNDFVVGYENCGRFFCPQMDGGVLWQKIKRKKSMLQ